MKLLEVVSLTELCRAVPGRSRIALESGVRHAGSSDCCVGLRNCGRIPRGEYGVGTS